MKMSLDRAVRQMIITRATVAAVVVVVGVLAGAIADAQGAGGGQPPRSAPPEALAACKAKAVGDACEMEIRGQSGSVSGQCIATPDDKIACMPDGAPRPPKS